MSAGPRQVRVRALAKINLSLRVLGRRPDGYHELRTVLQTVSLADSLALEFTPGRRTAIVVRSRPEIPDNLVERAAALALEAMRKPGRVEIRLAKRIPIGAGLGGGSSDAAAVLLALPVLAGKPLELSTLIELAGSLGSDVPFFLFGGTALGLGRGTELYPLRERPRDAVLLVVPELRVSTADAYQALGRQLTSSPPQNMISIFQSWTWSRNEDAQGAPVGENDFESVVFAEHPRLKVLKVRLIELGARAALLSGSGSAVFGIFLTRRAAERARRLFRDEKAFLVSFVSRARYRWLWRRWLQPHVEGQAWPPRSRYA